MNIDQLLVTATKATRHYVELGNRLFKSEMESPLPMPTILMTLRGTTAGTANYSKLELKYHPVLMSENEAEFVAETIPHEVSHLFQRHIYGQGVKSHGQEWKAIMRRFGIDPRRTHSYSVDTIRQRTHPHLVYCQCKDAKPLRVRASQAPQVARGKLRCCKCRSLFTLEPQQHTAASGQHGNCEVCGQTLSEKVRQFCKANTARFQGRLLCFDHQRAPVAKAEERSTGSTSGSNGHTCHQCGKAVSENVAKFCLSRQAQFGGRIFCFDHQR